MDTKTKVELAKYWHVLADIKMDAVVEHVERYLERAVEKGMGAPRS
jgi:hypothetical protein